VVFFMVILPSGGVKIALFAGKIEKSLKMGIIFHFPSLDVLLEIINYG